MEEYPESWLWEAFSVNLDGVVSTYGTCELTDSSRESKAILVSATNFNDKSEDHCFRLLRFDRSDHLRGTAPVLKFPGLPEFESHFRVLAVDSYLKEDGRTNVIAVAFMNSQSDYHFSGSSEDQFFLTIFRTSEIDEFVSQSVENPDSNSFEDSEHPLSYCPGVVTHSPMKSSSSPEKAFIVSGNDGNVYIYQDCSSVSGGIKFEEVNVQKHFPEFVFDSSASEGFLILWIDVKFDPSDSNHRISAVAWEDGTVQLALCSCEEDGAAVIHFRKLICFDGPVTQVRLFTSSEVDVSSPINLLVCTAIEFVYVYHNVKENMFDEAIQVDGSGLDADSVLCCATCDIDMDGQIEVIIGTFYQQIAVFKYSPLDDQYQLLWERQFPGPVRSLEVVDLSNDGANDLIVATNNSVHVLQHNVEFITKLCKKKLLQYVSTKMEDGSSASFPNHPV